MTRAHYEEALADDPPWAERARRLGERTYELMSFLIDVMRFTPADVRLDATFTYHDSCSGLRELGVHDQPRAMLGKVADWYEQEVDDAVEALTSLLEPLIMSVLGVLIGGLVIAMYLPIFKMGQAI